MYASTAGPRPICLGTVSRPPRSCPSGVCLPSPWIAPYLKAASDHTSWGMRLSRMVRTRNRRTGVVWIVFRCHPFTHAIAYVRVALCSYLGSSHVKPRTMSGSLAPTKSACEHVAGMTWSKLSSPRPRSTGRRSLPYHAFGPSGIIVTHEGSAC